MKKHLQNFRQSGKTLLASCLAFGLSSTFATAQNNSCDCATTTVINADFELPAVPVGLYQERLQADVPGWSSSLANGTESTIEIWGTTHNGVIAQSGGNFIELNVRDNTSLFQDVATCPGKVYMYSVYHRARVNSDETATVEVGAPGGPYTTLTTMVGQVGVWTHYSGAVYIPAGQTTTRIRLTAVSHAAGLPSYGNLVDNFEFSPISCSSNEYSCGNNNQKVVICHNGNTICVAASAVAAHLAHGCSIGECETALRTGQALETSELLVYPNPSNGNFTLKISALVDGPVQVQLMDALGRQVSTLFSGQMQADETREITSGNLAIPEGMYQVRLQSASGTENIKLIVE